MDLELASPGVLSESVFIPESCEQLGDDCFSKRESLLRVTFARGCRVNRFGKQAFNECVSLKEIEIPAAVEEICNDCFLKCSSLSRISFASGSVLKRFGEGAFSLCSSLERIEIPASVEEIGVRSFSSWFSCLPLECVTFAKGSRLKRIGELAFCRCEYLREIEIPASVEVLGRECFQRCFSLSSVIFESGSHLKRIEAQVFDSCVSLQEIELPASVEEIGNSPFLECRILKISFSGPNRFYRVQGPFLVSVDDEQIITVIGQPREVEIPASVEEIGKECFVTMNECNRYDEYDEYGKKLSRTLFRVTFAIGCKLKYIRDSAFAKCRMLQEIEIPATVEEIGSMCFHLCPSLSRVTFVSGCVLKRIGRDAFSGCESLQEIEIPASVEAIGAACFRDCESLCRVTFESGSCLKRVGTYAFARCKSLNKIALPASIEDIVGGMFTGCSDVSFSGPTDLFSIVDKFILRNLGMKLVTGFGQLESIEIPATVEELGKSCFSDRSSLRVVKFASGSIVKRIGADAFSFCENLRTIEIPASVEELGESCFSNCFELHSVVFSENSSLKSMGRWAFSQCESLEMIEIPASVTEIRAHCFYGCFNLFCVTFAPGINIKSLPAGMFAGCECLEMIKVPASVEVIGRSCFGPITSDSLEGVCCFCLERVIFTPDSKLKCIEDQAFEGCSSLRKLKIPAGVEKIGNRCFGMWAWDGDIHACYSLTHVTFAPGSALKSIGNEAFLSCVNLKNVDVPDTVEQIGIDCFSEEFLHRCLKSNNEQKKALVQLALDRVADIPDYWEEEEEFEIET